MKTDLEQIVPYIQTTGFASFCLYCYYVAKTKGEWTRVKISDAMNDLLLSKPSVIRKIIKLRDLGLIKAKKEIENGKKRWFVKAILGQVTLPMYPIHTNTNLVNIKSSKKDSNKKSGLKGIFQKILSIALSHPRFSNPYYKDRRWKFRSNEKKHIQHLIDNVSNIEDYMKWWLKDKAGRIPGLNVGMICCQPMIEEYRLRHGIPITKNRPMNREKDETKISGLRLEVAHQLVHELNTNPKYEMSKTDKEFLEDCIKEGVVRRKGDHYRIISKE